MAQYTIDDQWYRAEVIATPGRRNVEVLYVDYGNSEVVPFWRLKKISDKFLILPVQVFDSMLSFAFALVSMQCQKCGKFNVTFTNKRNQNC